MKMANGHHQQLTGTQNSPEDSTPRDLLVAQQNENSCSTSDCAWRAQEQSCMFNHGEGTIETRAPGEAAPWNSGRLCWTPGSVKMSYRPCGPLALDKVHHTWKIKAVWILGGFEASFLACFQLVFRIYLYWTTPRINIQHIYLYICLFIQHSYLYTLNSLREIGQPGLPGCYWREDMLSKWARSGKQHSFVISENK